MRGQQTSTCSQLGDVVIRQRAAQLFAQRTQNPPVLPRAARTRSCLPVDLWSAFQVHVCAILLHKSHTRQNQVRLLSTLISMVPLVYHESVFVYFLHIHLVTSKQPNQFGFLNVAIPFEIPSKPNILSSCTRGVPLHNVQTIPIFSDYVGVFRNLF